MKTLITLSFLLWAGCTSQKGYRQLEKARQACLAVQEGEYEMSHGIKPMSQPDTIFSTYKTTFRRMPNDTLFGIAFSTYLEASSKKIRKTNLYTGNELVIIPQQDSTSLYISTTLWSEYIKKIKQNFQFYPPLIRPNAAPIPTPKRFEKPHTLEWVGKEKIGNQTLRHWRVELPIPDPDTSQSITGLKITFDVWLEPRTAFPVRMAETFDLWVMGDTAIQYNDWHLTRHKWAPLTHPGILTMESVPDQYPLKNYQPPTPVPLLAPGVNAPDFTLPTLEGGQISLSDLKGKYVLVDFFYRSCYPCMMAMPHLGQFSQKYNDRNIVVIGIDPYDEATPELMQFFQNKGVNYPVLLNAKETSIAYQVTSYPALYFIGPDGKILESEAGYDKGSENDWEKWVEKHVK